MSSPLQRVLDTFERSLGRDHHTLLVGGFTEPEYLPVAQDQPAEIRFREDFLASALHEVAHWCIAGAKRRQQRDFGYWYRPEGRNPAQQLAFERAEVGPQAIEWIFSRASAQPFRLSRDNLGPSGCDSGFDFAQAVASQALEFLLEHSLPPRAARFADALAREFGVSDYRAHPWYDPSQLR